MAEYRVYCLDGQGQIGLADWIKAESDDEALAKTAKLNAGGCLEPPSTGRRLRTHDRFRHSPSSKSTQFLPGSRDAKSSPRRS